MSSEENFLSRLEQDFIFTESSTGQKQRELEILRNEINEKNDLVTNYELSFKQNHVIVERKQNYMDECNRLLAALLEAREVSLISFTSVHMFFTFST